MYGKFLWCYVFSLTLLDISLNTKLTAQGKSHGTTIHDSIADNIGFQEWGAESISSESNDSTDSIEGVALWPPALQFGPSALAAPHTRLVTLTNLANSTLHLASVAGTTPDFHAQYRHKGTQHSAWFTSGGRRGWCRRICIYTPLWGFRR
ncbi:unnamed protein product [Leptidea sinapis]|uniref:Transmembrane protein 131-like N-terminal domain-containing protein n=1 Tax=Leptidea sinapis TaxID=189913 RepID=A0A5E4PNG3_9NEOP|nr:unnamed protein product [Leptidea sinapis]